MKERFETFTGLIAKINRSIKKIKAEEMVDYELKSPHISCHYYLYKKDSLTSKELCELCDEDKAAISRSIDYLEEKGYIVCDSTSKRRYKARLCLTDEGRAVGAVIAEKVDKMLDRASEGLSEEDREVLYKALSLISGNLQKICEKYDS